MVGVVGPVRVTEAGRADQSATPSRRPGRAGRQEGVGSAQRRDAAADGRRRMFAAQFQDVGNRVVFLGEIANRRRLGVVISRRRQFRRRRVAHRRIRRRRRCRRVGTENVVDVAQYRRRSTFSAAVADHGVATPLHLPTGAVRRQTGDAVVVVLSRPALRYNWAVRLKNYIIFPPTISQRY